MTHLHPSQYQFVNGTRVPRDWAIRQITLNGDPYLLKWHLAHDGRHIPYIVDVDGYTYQVERIGGETTKHAILSGRLVIGYLDIIGDYATETD